MSTQLAPGPFPGDDIISDAVMLYDQTIIVAAPKDSVFPWLVQLGKGRGGWYLPKSWERLLPTSWRASRSILPKWQSLEPGQRVDDYGFDVEQDFFIVDRIDSKTGYLVYKSDRYGAHFTWTLLTHDLDDGLRTMVHLRFRGNIAATGLKRTLIVKGGGFVDWMSTTPMLMGLKERAESSQ